MKEVKAVVFQNFQILWTDKLKWKGDYGIVSYVKGVSNQFGDQHVKDEGTVRGHGN